MDVIDDDRALEPSNELRSDELAERPLLDVITRPMDTGEEVTINDRDSQDASDSVTGPESVPTVTSLEQRTAESSCSRSSGVASELQTNGDGYRIVDDFLYSVEPMRRRDVLGACPRLLWQMADDAWKPQVIELEFGEPEKRPLPDYYYVSMKTQLPAAATINRKRK